MKPSSLSTWATAILSRLAGMSTTGLSIRLALRIRVSMSANESVIMVGGPSPAGLLDARDQPVAGHVAEADPADAELAVDGARPAAQLAPQPDADLLARQHLDLVRRALAGLELGQLLLELHDLRFGCHVGSWPRRVSRLAEGHAEAPQQLPRLVVAVGAGDEGDVHALDEGHLVGVDLGEHLLLGQPQAVVAVPVEALGVDAAEVADTRQGDADQAVEELVHAPAAQRHPA